MGGIHYEGCTCTCSVNFPYFPSSNLLLCDYEVIMFNLPMVNTPRTCTRGKVIGHVVVVRTNIVISRDVGI